MNYAALHPATVAIHAGRGPRTPDAPLNPPLTLASSFHGGKYARQQGAPAWAAFEEAIGALDGGRSVSFASGIAAATAIIETLPAGAAVVGPTDGYAWTRSLLADRAANGRVRLTSVDTADTEATLRACVDADLLWLESPSNPMIEIAELDRRTAHPAAATGGRAADRTGTGPATGRASGRAHGALPGAAR
jgi:cystathionine gamma-synthase